MSVGLSEEQYDRLRNDIKQEVIAEVKEDIRDELHSASEVEVRSDEDNTGLSDIWIAGNPVGTLLDKALQNSSDAKKTAEQAAASGSSAENPEGKGSENDMENSLPIQQITKIWKVGGTINANKTEHAAALWSDFFDRAKNGQEVLYLPTDKVEQILKEHFRQDGRHLGVTKNTKRATVHRAMDALEDLAGNLVSSNIIKNGRRALMINQQEFQDFCEAIGATTDVTPDTATGVTRGS